MDAEPSGAGRADALPVSPTAARHADPIAPDALEPLREVPLELTVELGRVRLPLAQVADLARGAVIELERLAGEPLDVLLGGRLVARGEVVTLGERLGVRVTEIVEPVAD